MNALQYISRLISAIFSPIIVPTYAVALGIELTYLYTLPSGTVLPVLGWTLFFTAILPLIGIFLMMKLGIVTDSGLNKQGERMWPYILSALCYGGCALFLRHLHAPAWLYMFLVGGAVAGLVNMAVNFKWKISGHGAAMGGLVSFLIFIAYNGLNAWPIDGWIFGAIIATGVTGTSRLILERHTLMQVAAGIANGIVWVWLALMLAE
ncbi:MAG: hypothetical protein K2J97_05010 [Muribaculaceae bacterium]|nr:hypothetical protein [Muribaculaceae bacterium]MDE6645422.1 hypothetical protein [Muribaculaceae bacterium]